MSSDRDQQESVDPTLPQPVPDPQPAGSTPFDLDSGVDDAQHGTEAAQSFEAPAPEEIEAAPARSLLGLGSGLMLALAVLLALWRLDWPALSLAQGEVASRGAALLQGWSWPELGGAVLHPWLLLPGFARLGTTELAARLPSSIGALALLLALLLPGWSAAKSARWPAGVALVAMPLWFIAGRALDSTTVGALWGAVAMALVLGADLRQGLRRWQGALFFLVGAFAWLLGAGPTALVLPWLAMALHLLLHRRLRALLAFANHRGVLLALLVLLLAAAAMLFGSEAGQRQAALGDLAAALRAWTEPPLFDWSRQTPWLGLLPVALLLPMGILNLRRDEAPRLAALALFLCLLLSLVSPLNPLVLALLALPALARLAGLEVARRWGPGGTRALPELWLVVLGLVLGAVIIASAAPQVPEAVALWWRGIDFQPRLIVAGALLAVAIPVAAILLLGRHGLAVLVALVGVAALWVATLSQLGAAINAAYSHRDFLLQARRNLGDETPWLALAPPGGGGAFYLGAPIDVVADSNELAARLTAGPHLVLAPADLLLEGGQLIDVEARAMAAVPLPPPLYDPPLAIWRFAAQPPDSLAPSLPNAEPEEFAPSDTPFVPQLSPEAAPDDASPAPDSVSPPNGQPAPAETPGEGLIPEGQSRRGVLI